MWPREAAPGPQDAHPVAPGKVVGLAVGSSPEGEDAGEKVSEAICQGGYS